MFLLFIDRSEANHYSHMHIAQIAYNNVIQNFHRVENVLIYYLLSDSKVDAKKSGWTF